MISNLEIEEAYVVMVINGVLDTVVYPGGNDTIYIDGLGAGVYDDWIAAKLVSGDTLTYPGSMLIEEEGPTLTNQSYSASVCGASGWVVGNSTMASYAKLYDYSGALLEEMYTCNNWGFDSLMPGTYFVRIFDYSGCYSQGVTFTIAGNKKSPLTIKTQNTAFCDSKKGVVEFYFNEDIAYISYANSSFHCGDGRIDSLISGIYTVSGFLVNQCAFEFTTAVYADPAPEVFVSNITPPTCDIAGDGSAYIDIKGRYDYLFIDGVEVFDFSIVNLATGSVQIDIYDRGCVFRNSILIPESTEECVHIYTNFTPNGDGMNDFFEIIVPLGTIVSVQVFDINGQTVYESQDYLNGWAGDKDGEILPSGDYPAIVAITLPVIGEEEPTTTTTIQTIINLKR